MLSQAFQDQRVLQSIAFANLVGELDIEIVGFCDDEINDSFFDRRLDKASDLEPRNRQVLGNFRFCLATDKMPSSRDGRLDTLNGVAGHGWIYGPF